MFAQPSAILALADGTTFTGQLIGAEGKAKGEVVFNTAMSGYQEILTDPSYVYQMITFTMPHLGNVGVNPDDVESKKVHAAGVICREFCAQPSNCRAKSSLKEFLVAHPVTGISGIDTRKLVLHLRTHGAQMGVIGAGDVQADELVAEARALASMNGLDLAQHVTTGAAYSWSEGAWRFGVGYEEQSAQLEGKPHVVALDFGIKRNILRLLASAGLQVTVVPATYSAQQIRALKPDGLFLSNGPGDPAAVQYAIATVRALLGEVPMFGICLGHQILGLALGLKTYKLKFGHRGGNHPVRNERTKKVEITVQNHGFAVSPDGLPQGVEITHINLNDNTVEGLAVPGKKAFSVQYHPESSPGPQDAQYLFNEFQRLVAGSQKGESCRSG